MKINLNDKAEVNLNDKAEVVLTADGLRRLLDDEAKQTGAPPMAFPPGFWCSPDGPKFKTQMWNLARIFGPAMVFGGPVQMFVDNQVEITPSGVVPEPPEPDHNLRAAVRALIAEIRAVKIEGTASSVGILDLRGTSKLESAIAAVEAHL